MPKLLLLLAFCAVLAGCAGGDTPADPMRFLPTDGQRGTVGAARTLPEVIIGGKVLRLAPGATIYDRNNRTILAANLPPGSDVLYTKDASGNVTRIYILTDIEKARLASLGKR